MKMCWSSIVFLLYGNTREQLELFSCVFFYSFRKRTSTVFSKRFETELLMVNGKKIQCSSPVNDSFSGKFS